MQIDETQDLLMSQIKLCLCVARNVRALGFAADTTQRIEPCCSFSFSALKDTILK